MNEDNTPVKHPEGGHAHHIPQQFIVSLIKFSENPGQVSEI